MNILVHNGTPKFFIYLAAETGGNILLFKGNNNTTANISQKLQMKQQDDVQNGYRNYLAFL